MRHKSPALYHWCSYFIVADLDFKVFNVFIPMFLFYCKPPQSFKTLGLAAYKLNKQTTNKQIRQIHTEAAEEANV